MSILGPIFAQDPARIAARVGDERIDYARFCADIDAMARWLLGQGLEPGQRVSLHPHASSHAGYRDWIMHLGAIRAGLVHSSGLNRSLRARAAFAPLAAAIGVPAYLPDGQFASRLLPFAPEDMAPLSEQLGGALAPVPLDGLEQSSARLIATSGTTGMAKVVRWDAPMMERRIAQVLDAGEVTSETVLAPLLDFLTTAGYRYPMATWSVGGCVILKTANTLIHEGFADLTASNVLVASAFALQEFFARQPEAWKGREQRTVTLVGGRIPPGLRDRVIGSVGASVRNVYGSTEAGSIAIGDAALIDRHPGAVGRLFPGVEVEIVDPGHEPLDRGREGLVRVRSGSSITAYAFVPPRQAGSGGFRDGWFYPGDLGMFLEDGVLAVTGRIADSLNFRGAKIDAAAIEARIEQIDSIEAACVCVVALPELDVLTVAVVISGEPDFAKLRPAIAGHLPFDAPFRIVRLPHLPRTGMGKLMRRKLEQHLAAHFTRRRVPE